MCDNPVELSNTNDEQDSQLLLYLMSTGYLDLYPELSKVFVDLGNHEIRVALDQLTKYHAIKKEKIPSALNNKLKSYINSISKGVKFYFNRKVKKDVKKVDFDYASCKNVPNCHCVSGPQSFNLIHKLNF
ncbi:hypothetical protein K502DRAFT_326351 [Neoconidiobolus thromboides FSU 785]|nr:hypothetical protein K502DRAFT_326351 [Neoconidiobolus thromboides FSU 785]